MKKLTLTAASLMAAVSVYAQGTVDFQNFLAPEGIGNDRTGAPVVVADNIVAQLYWSATMSGVYMAVGTPTMVGDAFGTPFPGYFGALDAIRIDQITPAGGTAFFEVRAWESTYGNTFEAAIAAGPMNGRVALRGVSGPFEIDTGNPLASPPDIPPDVGSFMPNFSVNVPEPSVVALGIIGAGALLLLRRRK